MKDKAREETACSLCGNSDICYSHKPTINGKASGDVCSISLIKADKILSLNCIQVKAEDQSLPKTRCKIKMRPMLSATYLKGYSEAQQDMLNDGWIRGSKR